VALGIDHGARRIGVAASDALGISATPLEVIEGRKPEQAAERVAALAREHGAVVLVFGMPVNMDGSEHASAAVVTRFAEECGRRAGLPVEFVDERLTTVQAERHLRDAGLTRGKRKKRVDQVAAVLLLQSWLDARSS
jgi:putative Holliday junction resolvase